MAIQISSVQDFMAMADWSDRGSTESYLQVELTEDIDFSEIENFEGLNGSWYMDFDGNGHTIKGITAVTDACWSIFNGADTDNYYGSIVNLKIANSTITTAVDKKTATLCYNACNCTFYNVIIENTVALMGGDIVCGFCVKTEGTCFFEKCRVSAKITTLFNAGLVCGFCTCEGTSGTSTGRNHSKMYNCVSTASLAGYRSFGLIYGYKYSYTTVTNCYFMGMTANNNTVASTGGSTGALYTGVGSAYCCYCLYTISGNKAFGSVYLFYIGNGCKAVCGSVRNPNNLDITVTPGNPDVTIATEEQLKSVEWLRELGFAI